MDNNFELYTEKTELLKVLAHPVRICIIRGLMDRDNCNVNTMQSCLQLPQPTVSRHLQLLKGAGIIKGTRKGNEIFYTLSNNKIEKVIQALFED
jgi:ArsR family transcriptional regulator